MKATQKIVTSHPTAAVFDYSTSNKLRTIFFDFVDQLYLPDPRKVDPELADQVIALVVNHDATVEEVDRILDDALTRMDLPIVSTERPARRIRLVARRT